MLVGMVISKTDTRPPAVLATVIGVSRVSALEAMIRRRVVYNRGTMGFKVVDMTISIVSGVPGTGAT